MRENHSHTQALIQYRMERAYQTLNTAQLLQEQNTDTASIVNRAYYAMFYAALDLLATIGEETSKHSGVMALFDRHFIKTGVLPKEMGKFLHTAFDVRQTGDYEDKPEISQAMAEQILEFAVKFVKSVEEKLQGQT
ncbi:MAG: HEPN domain-containing protein [Anaerolineales bacterium]|nr:HEPN domain-containing protein [Anaerolineales bacterium]